MPWEHYQEVSKGHKGLTLGGTCCKLEEVLTALEKLHHYRAYLSKSFLCVWVCVCTLHTAHDISNKIISAVKCNAFYGYCKDVHVVCTNLIIGPSPTLSYVPELSISCISHMTSCVIHTMAFSSTYNNGIIPYTQPPLLHTFSEYPFLAPSSNNFPISSVNSNRPMSICLESKEKIAS